MDQSRWRDVRTISQKLAQTCTLIRHFNRLSLFQVVICFLLCVSSRRILSLFHSRASQRLKFIVFNISTFGSKQNLSFFRCSPLENCKLVALNARGKRKIKQNFGLLSLLCAINSSEIRFDFYSSCRCFFPSVNRLFRRATFSLKAFIIIASKKHSHFQSFLLLLFAILGWINFWFEPLHIDIYVFFVFVFRSFVSFFSSLWSDFRLERQIRTESEGVYRVASIKSRKSCEKYY